MVNENIGLARIQSYLRRNNIDAELTYLSMDKGVAQQTENINQSVKYYGISLFYWYNDFAFELCEYIKQINPHAVIFMGGRGVTDAYRLIFEDCNFFDFAVLGHGESTLVYAIKELEQGKSVFEVSSSCKYLASRNDLENKEELYENINELCLPERTYTKNKLTTASIITAHGCVGNCTFCSWNKSKARWCGRNMQDVYEEIISIYENTGIRNFMFCDGSFEDPGRLGKQRINELCALLEKYPAKFSFKYFLRAETFKDKQEDIELLHRMRRNGFVTAFVGIEAGNNADLIVFNKKARVEDNENIINILKKVDIEILYGFIMLNPYSTIDSLRSNYHFLVNFRCQHLFNFVNTLEVYYNTEFYRCMKRDGLLKKEYRYDKPHLYRCQHKNVENIKNFIRKYFSRESAIMKKYDVFYDNIDYFNGVKALYNDVYNFYSPILEDCYLSLCKLLKDYFYALYEKNDILACIDMYGELCESLEVQYERVSVVRNRMMRELLRMRENDTNNKLQGG